MIIQPAFRTESRFLFTVKNQDGILVKNKMDKVA